MRDRDLYAKRPGIDTPWYVRDVEARLEEREVEVLISFADTEDATCSVCGVACSRYDTRTRSWRHLDTMQYWTLLTADVPRVKCAEHGVKSVKVPWAEPGSRFTALFEALVIDWLKETSTSGVARMLGMSWDEVHGVMSRAVARGLERRKSQPLRAIGIDETSFQRRLSMPTTKRGKLRASRRSDEHGAAALDDALHDLGPAFVRWAGRWGRNMFRSGKVTQQ